MLVMAGDKLFLCEYVTSDKKDVTYFILYRLALDLVVIYIANFMMTAEYLLLGYIDPEAKTGRKTLNWGVVSGE